MWSYLFTLVMLINVYPGPNKRPLLYKGKNSIPTPLSIKTSRPYDIQHYKIGLSVDALHDSIWGYTDVSMKSQVDGLDTLLLYLVSFTVDSVVSDSASCSFYREDSLFHIDLPLPLDQGESTTVCIYYHGVPTIGGGVFGGGLHITDSIVYVDDEPWGAKRWFPCLDAPDDKGTSELIIRVPEGYDLVGNGVLVDTSNQDGWKTFHWVESYPIATYLIVFAASPYYVRGDTFFVYEGDTLPIYFWVYGADSVDAAYRFRHTPDMIACFTDRYGPYPFLTEKYAHVEAPIGGAMENQTNTFIVFTNWGSDWDWVVSHELSHQWWGDWVTLGTWADIWLNEGFATYSQAIYYEWRDGEQAFHDYMKNSIMDYFLSVEPYYSFPIYDPDYLFTPVTYEKAASVLHMLRHVVGDSTFFNILKTYGQTYAYQSAVTDDFINIAESVSGMDLGWFFDEWLYQIGHPIYSYTWDYNQVGPDSFRVTLHVSQVQEHTGGVPTFTMPIDIAFALSGGDTLLEQIWDDDDNEIYYFWMDKPPVNVLLDPNDWILCEKSGHPQVSEREIEGTPVKVTINSNLSTEYVEGSISLTEDFSFTLGLFDVSGRQVRKIFNGKMSKGVHSIEFKWPTSLPSGLYFIILKDGKGHTMKSMPVIHLP